MEEDRRRGAGKDALLEERKACGPKKVLSNPITDPRRSSGGDEGGGKANGSVYSHVTPLHCTTRCYK